MLPPASFSCKETFVPVLIYFDQTMREKYVRNKPNKLHITTNMQRWDSFMLGRKSWWKTCIPQTLSGFLELLLSSLDQSLTWSRLNKACIWSDTLITCVHTVKPHPELSHLLSRNLHPWLRLKTLMSLCQFNQTRNKRQMLKLLHLINIRIHVIRVGIGDHLTDLCDKS